jgi:hypothetical protein
MRALIDNESPSDLGDHDYLPAPSRPRNFCVSCGLDFNALAGFDRHRTGNHDYLADEAHPDGRRCRTVPELCELGFVQDKHGRWYQPTETAPADWAAIRAARNGH